MLCLCSDCVLLGYKGLNKHIKYAQRPFMFRPATTEPSAQSVTVVLAHNTKVERNNFSN